MIIIVTFEVQDKMYTFVISLWCACSFEFFRALFCLGIICKMFQRLKKINVDHLKMFCEEVHLAPCFSLTLSKFQIVHVFPHIGLRCTWYHLTLLLLGEDICIQTHIHNPSAPEAVRKKNQNKLEIMRGKSRKS